MTLCLFSDYTRSGLINFAPRSGYDELDTTLMPPRPGEQFPGGQTGNPATGTGSQGKNSEKSQKMLFYFFQS